MNDTTKLPEPSAEPSKNVLETIIDFKRFLDEGLKPEYFIVDDGEVLTPQDVLNGIFEGFCLSDWTSEEDWYVQERVDLLNQPGFKEICVKLCERYPEFLEDGLDIYDQIKFHLESGD